MSEGYALENSWQRAPGRLSSLESTYDRFSLPLLDGLGIPPDAVCLEVGCGAGSVARHLAAAVGPKGRVVAVDIDVSLFGEPPARVDLRQGDIATIDLPPGSFDLVHTRMVLNHLPDRDAVLRSLVASLRTGGFLLLEEGDAFPTDVLEEGLHSEVLARVYDGLARRGSDVRLGRRLAGMLTATGAIEVVEARCVVPQIQGGSAQTEFLLGSEAQLHERGELPGLADEDRRAWHELLRRRDRWFTGLGLYQVIARRTR
jgi:SAM-dependent methyltransferase